MSQLSMNDQQRSVAALIPFGSAERGGAAAAAAAEALKCPRCESRNTKFCYYNNYNMSQPRYLCKSCRRYWTQGGSLRNIPIGGATRKKNSKRPNPTASAAAVAAAPAKRASSPSIIVLNSSDPKPETHPDTDVCDTMGFTSSFSSLLLQANDNHHHHMQLDNLLDAPARGDPNYILNGWPDLAIYASPGSSFH